MSTIDSHEPTPFVEAAAFFVLSFAVTASLQTAYGWWLNSGRGVLRTVLVLLALGVLSAFRRSGRPLGARTRALWAGAISGMTVVLLWTGPGNLWPIVLAVAAAMSFGAVFGGALLGFAVTRLWR